MTDEHILQLIRKEKQEERGFRLLMQKYQEKLYQHIRRIVREHEDANDVLQNTFIKVFRHINKFQGNSSLYTWIYRIAANEALTHVSKSQRLKIVNVSEGEENGLENRASDEISPEPNMINSLLDSAMNTLPDRQRSVFSLRYHDELSYKEISNIMGATEGALKASYHHAVKKIEQYFKQANIY